MAIHLHITAAQVRAPHLHPVRATLDHLLADHHTSGHRCTVGIAVMVVGVSLAKYGGHVDVLIVAGLFDMVGYAVHGLGCVPFIDLAVKHFSSKE